ncbi:MAG: DUF5060 domain-containing protein [Armatimonadetes bacterium]|nr:DUF5060 domain-containing protein [Armatimonadota bacterium]
MLAVVITLSAQADAATPFAQAGPLALRAVRLNAASVPSFGRLEMTLDLSATYDNPFDPDQVSLYADFHSPQGRTVRVNGFLNQPFTRRLDGGYEHVTPAGRPFWCIRFAPDAVGTWRARVVVRDRTGTAARAVAFRVMPSASPGFVRRSRRNPAVFAYDNGKPFFLVGENMGWGNGPGTFSYDDWLPKLGRAGGDWIRLWMGTWLALEWPPDKGVTGDGVPQAGLGVYNLANAWRVDQILDTAQKSGVSVMLCLGTYGEFTTGGFFNEGQWKNNPYNAANGGPCAKPEDFWTDATARKFYRMRLRYLAARYGWRTNLHSWEFWNEAPNTPAAWVGEMAQALKGGLDPYRHLITTTYGSDAIWKVPELDFTQTHSYGTGDIPDHAPVVRDDARAFAHYGKPHLMGEFGIDWRKSDIEYDQQGLGVNWHNGLWAGALSGDAGGAMLWWWDNYIAPKDIYGQLTPLRRFADTVPWTAGPWATLTMDAPRTAGGPETFTDLVLPGAAGWGRSAATDFTLTQEGASKAPGLPAFLYSPGKPDLRTTPTFHVNYRRPGRFLVHVDQVSNAADLHVLLDGRVAREIPMSAAPPSDPSVKPEYESTQLHPEFGGVYQAQWNREYGIDVPAGAHTITLDVASGDWLHIDRYTLTDYRSSRYPDVTLIGLRHGARAILWAQNAGHTWKDVYEKRPIPTITGAATVVRGLPDGRYQIAWWDTTRGVVTRREVVSARGGSLPLRLPPLATDVAARIIPQK